MLKKNLELNPFENIELNHVAVSDKSGVLKLYKGPPGNHSETTTAASSGFELECEVRAAPLSELVSVEDFRKVRLIKMDIEGAEYAAMKGLSELMPHAHPELEIVAEANIWPSKDEGSHASDIIELMKSYGFHAYRIKNDYSLDPYTTSQPFSAPQRLRNITEERCDLIFSKTDAESL